MWYGYNNNDKVDRVLALYKKLMNGGLIYKSEEAVLYNVSERTVQRDIDEICDFLERNERNDGIYMMSYMTEWEKDIV